MSHPEAPIDLLVVGGGTAGIVGSKTAAGLGARVVLVERERTGGDCLWTGCVPSKALLAIASRARDERALTGRAPDFAEVRRLVSAAVDTIAPVDSPEALEAAGVRVVSGDVSLLAPGLAEVNGETLKFRQALIATGAAPAPCDIPGLDPRFMHNSDSIWGLEILPRRLAIVGGGPVTCELGQAFARLGAEVTLIVRSTLLSDADPEAASLVEESLRRDGVRIVRPDTVTRAECSEVECSEAGAVLITARGERIETDVVLLAVGRRPRTSGLGLDRVGVRLDAAGRVLTDESMRTSNPLVWAAGDVTANPQFTHVAGVHASVAATNAVLGLRRRVSAVVPRVTFTSPEVASVGVLSTTAAPGLIERTIAHTHIDRAIAEGNVEGFTRLIVDRRGRVRGGTIVSPRAGESLAEVALAVQHGLTTADIAGTTHAYPTYSDGVWNAAIADVRARLGSPGAARAMRTLAWWRKRVTARWRKNIQI